MEWVSVKDRLPKYDVEVLAYDPEFGGGEIGLFRLEVDFKIKEGKWWSLYPGCWGNDYHITHWMPLPELPTKEES
jgi:hypothetical protein